MIDLKNLTIKKAHNAFIKGEYTAVDLANAYLEQIKKKDKDIHTYLEVFSDVIEQAKIADEKIKNGKANLLTGIPIAIKDNILIKGRIVSAGSKILENYKATYDATVIEKLKKEGAIFIGRTNMDEFAMGSSTENSAYGPTKNPNDLERVSGGSSGGSAVAVAGDMALISLGSDTGGSIRQPASFCGLIGLKPTYGSISRYGLIAMGSSLDQIGPFGKSIEDVEILFNVIKGYDKMDSTTYADNANENTTQINADNIKDADNADKNTTRINADKIKDANNTNINSKFKIGVSRDIFNNGGIDESIKKNFEESLIKLKNLGYEIIDIELPNLKYSLAVYCIIVFAEISSNMARYDGMRYGKRVSGNIGIEDYFFSRQVGLGREVKRRIILGTYVLSSGYYDAYYNKANIVRELIKNDYKKAFEKVDIIATPTTPSVAFKIGEKIDDPLQMYLEDIFTVPINLVGIPAISIPSGVKNIDLSAMSAQAGLSAMSAQADGKNLPIGIQFIANYCEEEKLFNLSKNFLGENVVDL
ncbi:MAG: amidase family protein [bacterium]